MDPIGVIITGQTRTFFDEDVKSSFIEFIKGLRTKYDIYMVLVINDKIIIPEKYLFLKEYVHTYIILDYASDSTVFQYKDEIFNNIIYIENTLPGVRELREKESNGYSLLESFYHQITQIQYGYEILKTLGIRLKYIIRTRFDILYSINIIPFSNNSEIFPHSTDHEYIHNSLYKRYNIKNTEEYIDIAKNLSYESPLRLYDYIATMGFGGRYFNNTDIYNTNKKVYMYNDHILIGTPDVFETVMNVWNLFRNRDILHKLVLHYKINFVFAPESMFLLHFLHNYITPIMYLDNTWDIKR